TTTIAKAVAKHFGMDFFSTGDIFRKVAKERNLQVAKLSGIAEQEVDWEVDNKCKLVAQKGNVVIESDIAAWYVDGAIKIWLDAPLMVRAERVFKDIKRVAERYKNLAEVVKKIKERRDRDRDRYMQRYGYNVDDTSIYDYKIDTEFLGMREVINTVIGYVAKRLKTPK
ncbi:TPA: (d)CMP kinase, partial [archaeon]|nr:(d)CMP kinase [Candidatus Naiadarchaeales archaeon SRR2090153.bin1042]